MEEKDLVQSLGTEIPLDFRSLSGFKLRLSVNDDQTEAYITLDDFPMSFSVPEAVGQLKGIVTRKITEGLLSDFFEKELPDILTRKIPIFKRLVAKTQPAILGKDSRIEFLVPRPSAEFIIGPTGTCDFRNRDLFRSVSEGEIILKRYPPEGGIPGKNVFGKTLLALNPQNTVVFPGKGVILENAGEVEVFRSTAAGQVVYNFNFSSVGVNISPILQIHRNVDFNTGNINFKGSVEISGSVLSGFSIVATGNVQVMGMVEPGAKITSGGDIFIGKGILGSHIKENGAEIKSFGNIQALYAENAKITAEGSIFLRSALNCIISTNKELFLEKNLIGGEAVAFKSVTAGAIGNDLEGKTVVRVGVSHTTLNRLNLMVKILTDLKDQLGKTEKNLFFLKVKGNAIDPEKREKLREVLESKVISLKDQITKLEMKKADLALEILELNLSTVSGREFYPGVTLYIRSGVYAIDREYKMATFYQLLPEEKIEFRPYLPDNKSKSAGLKLPKSR